MASSSPTKRRTKHKGNEDVGFRMKKHAVVKRKATLIKKAQQLSILCDSKVCFICLGLDGELCTWPKNQPQLKSILTEYQQLDAAKKGKSKFNLSGFLGNQSKQLAEKVLKNLDEEIHELPRDSLMGFGNFLDSKLRVLNEKIEMLEKNVKGKENFQHSDDTHEKIYGSKIIDDNIYGSDFADMLHDFNSPTLDTSNQTVSAMSSDFNPMLQWCSYSADVGTSSGSYEVGSTLSWQPEMGFETSENSGLWGDNNVDFAHLQSNFPSGSGQFMDFATAANINDRVCWFPQVWPAQDVPMSVFPQQQPISVFRQQPISVFQSQQPISVFQRQQPIAGFQQPFSMFQQQPSEPFTSCKDNGFSGSGFSQTFMFYPK